jgi:hypothetical protein
VKEFVGLGIAVAPIIAKILWKEAEAPQWVVPPIVEIHYRASRRFERARNGSQKSRIVSLSTDQSVKTNDAV